MTSVHSDAEGNELHLEDILGTEKDIVTKGKVSSNIGLMTFKEYEKFMNAPHRMDLMISSMEKHGCWNCNQKCLHCYASGEKLSNVDELSTNEWKKIIDILKELVVYRKTRKLDLLRLFI